MKLAIPAVVVAAAMSILTLPGSARACTCSGRPDRHVTALPSPGAKDVPTNTRVLLWLGRDLKVQDVDLRVGDEKVPFDIVKLERARIWELIPRVRLAPRAELEVAQVRDDRTAKADFVFSVWTAADGAALDTTRPPDVHLQVLPGVKVQEGKSWLQLGVSALSCEVPRFIFHRGAKTLRVGVRARDLAGNLGGLTEVVLDLTAPKR